MKRFAWLGLFWPVALLALPNVYDDPVRLYDEPVQADTTYGDGRYVAHVPGTWNVVHSESLWVPDPDSTGTGVAFRAYLMSDSTFLVISYDTLAAVAQDSTWVDSVWSANSIGTPYAYGVIVPQRASGDSTLAAIGITATESAAIAMVVGYPYKQAPYSIARLTEYDSTLEDFGDFWYTYWTTDTTYALYITGQQYDRVAVWYRYWWRTGDTTWLNKAHHWGRYWRDHYVLPNDGAVQTYYAHVEGMALDYLIMDDTASRSAVLQIANKLNPWINTMQTTAYRDGRIQGYAVLGVLWPAVLNFPDTLRDNDSTLDAGIDSLISWYEAQDTRPGHWNMIDYTDNCVGDSIQANFQAAHALLYTLGRYYDLVDSTKDTIPVIVKSTLDTMWASRHTDYPTLRYLSAYCGSANDTSYAGGKDLNGLFVAPYAWYFRWTCNNSTCDSTYFYRADTLLDGMIDNTYWGPQIVGNMGGNKQYNQSFWQSQLGLYWLSGGP